MGDALERASASDVLALRREDVAVLAAAHRKARLSPAWGLAPFPAGLGTAGALLTLGELLSWPTTLWPVPVAAGALVSAVVAVVLTRRERRRLAPLAFDCPECGAPILRATSGTAVDDRRAELVITTGCCPACGAQIAVA